MTTDEMDRSSDSSPLPPPQMDMADKNSRHQLHGDFTGEQMMFSDEEDLDDASIKNSARGTQLGTNQMFVASTILMAWFLGAFGFSLAWVLIMMASIHVFWWSSVVRLVDENVQYEQLRVRRLKAVQHDESAEWLNFIVNRWWVLSSASVFAHAKSILEPVLNSSKPNFIDTVLVKELTLGGQTPSISAIKAFEVINGHRRAMALNSVANLAGLQSIRYRVVVEADLDVVCPNFKMVLGFYSGKVSVKMAVDFVVTKLFLKGRVQVTLQFSADTKFPHVSKATFMFLHKPKVHFDADQKVLRSSLKSWANNLFMNVLTDAMVDPFRLEIDLGPEDNFLPANDSNNTLAKGVLTVTLSLRGKSGKQTNNQDERWCTLKVGDQKHKTSCLPYRYSFLIESLAEDVLVIKVKTNRFIGTHTLETFREPLAAIAQDRNESVERNLSRGSVNLSLRMDYVGLVPPTTLMQNNGSLTRVNTVSSLLGSAAVTDTNIMDGEIADEIDSADINKEVVAGVLYICIHEADGLGCGQNKEIVNPYCVVIYKGKKVKKTHFIAQTMKPSWESEVELLVADYTQVSFTVAVCSWDNVKMIESDFLGLATVNMISGKRKLIRQQFRLDQSANRNDEGDCSAAIITISVIFRPVPSVACSGVQLQEDTCSAPSGGSGEEEVGLFRKRTSVPLVSETKQLLSTIDSERPQTDIPSTLASGHGLMEITILKATDLVSKDFNGYSDPYCEVKLNQDLKYKSNVKKKTLQPTWNEKVIMQLPKNDDIVSVVVWDHDVFSRKDFLGSVSLSLTDIQIASTKEAGDWFPLRETTSGSIQLKFRIISEGLENTEIRLTSTEELRAITPVLDLSRTAQPNFYGEGALLGQTQTANGSLYETLTATSAMTTTLSVTNTNAPTDDDAVPAMPLKIRTIVQKDSSMARFTTTSSSTSTGSSPQLSIRSFTAQSTSSSYSAGITLAQMIPRDNNGTSTASIATPNPPNVTNSNSKVPAPSPPERKSSLPSISSHSDIITLSVDNSIEESPKVTTSLTRGSMAYASLHNVKRKMKKSFTQQLRRFRSEVNVHEEKPKVFKDRVTIEKRDDTYASCGQIDTLEPDVDVSPNGELDKEVPSKRTHYFNVLGTVIQATGLEMPKTPHLSCRVRLLPSAAPGRNAKMAMKTLSKTKLMPSSPHPAFNLDFHIDGEMPASTLLVFEIRTAGKEIAASKSITLQELFQDAANEGNEVRTCLSLSSGATLEVSASHGKELDDSLSPQRKVSKLLRSWSIHRIGKI